MNALDRYLLPVARALVTIFDGLAVTFSYLFRRPVTIQYPDRTEKPVADMLPERSRGILEVDLQICTGCSMCAKTCPIDCIKIEVQSEPATKQRYLTRFDIDIGKCMFCGLCVEACPTGAIRHSHEFEGTTCDVRRLVLHFVESARPVARPPKKGEEPASPALGSIVRPLLGTAFDPYRPPKPVQLPQPATEAADAEGGNR
jgi:formate hydrogenlyase subunit 6/NADH:ubiquinone oxidoreductase subunit I